MKTSPSGIHAVSPYSRSQGSGTGWREEGGKACVYIRMVVHANYVTYGAVTPSPWLNILTSCRPSLTPPYLSPPVTVLPSGRVGKHGALDALLRRLLGHLAHLPHRS